MPENEAPAAVSLQYSLRVMSRADWLELGTRLYGPDPREWKFRCVRCGNVQSHASVKARNPQIGDTSNWIFFSCEGRHTSGVGCDWTLGGLFTIHKLEVLDDRDGKPIPCFEFADELSPTEPASES